MRSTYSSVLGLTLASVVLAVALPGAAVAADGSPAVVGDGSQGFVGNYLVSGSHWFTYTGSDYETHRIDSPPLETCIVLDPPAYGPFSNDTVAEQVLLFGNSDCSGAPAAVVTPPPGGAKKRAFSMILHRAMTQATGVNRQTTPDPTWGDVLNTFFPS